MIRLFRIQGVQVRLDAGWALVFGVLAWSLASGHFPYVLPARTGAAYWAGGLLAAGLLFASIFLHELSHALVAQLYGMRVSAITLHVFGGVSEMESEPPHPAAEAVIAIVGPLTSLAIGGSVLVARHAAAEADWAAALLGYVALVNVAVALFNLVPGFPLDGGRLLRALLWWWSDNADGATTVASRVGSIFALTLAAFGLVRLYHRDMAGGIWFVLLGVFLFQGARSSAQVIRVKRRLEAVTVERVMTPAPGDVMLSHDPDLVVAPDDSAWVALTRLARNPAGDVTVVEGDRIVGVITRADLRRVLAEPDDRPLDRVA